MITGKAAFDILADAAQSFVGRNYNRNGLTYNLEFCESVTGPWSALVEVGGIYMIREIVPAGVDALVVRYTVEASGNRPRVDPLRDIRVLTSVELPDNPSNSDLVEVARRFLEDAR